MVEVLREGYQIPFLSPPPLSRSPVGFDSYAPGSIRGQALEKELQDLVVKGAVEPATPSPGYYSRMFVVQKASGAWRPIIDLSTLNHFILKTKFKMETVQSMLASVRQGDWMISIDLKDAYFQIPVHPNSRPYLRFVTGSGVFQFKVICFGLTTAPQVFTRVMAPVSAILHQAGVRMLRYLDDWLVQAPSREACLRARDMVLDLCMDFGIRVNYEKSHLVPSQMATYLGVDLDSIRLRASPTLKRRDKVYSLVEDFLSCGLQPAVSWQILLGHLSSLVQLVPGGRLRMRALQIQLHRGWDFLSEEAMVPWTPQCQEDLLWWTQENRLQAGISLSSVLPDLMFWSDASDRGWGAHLGSEVVSGLWTETERDRSINWRELRAVRLGLRAFRTRFEADTTVAVFVDNTTAVAYLRKQGGTRSESLNEEAQAILRWAEENEITLLPQFILGRHNVLADSLSRGHSVQGSEWTLCQEVFDQLQRKWPVTVDLFATPLNFRTQVFFCPFQDPQSAGTDAFLQDWEGLQAYAFPPFSLVRAVLNKVRGTRNVDLTLVAPYWPQKEWFPDLLEAAVEPPVRLPERSDLLRQPHFHRFHLRLSVLHLHAWRLSGGSPGMRASPLV